MNALANMRLKHKIWLNQKMQKEIKKRYKKGYACSFPAKSLSGVRKSMQWHSFLQH
jgi:hypothetical protein